MATGSAIIGCKLSVQQLYLVQLIPQCAHDIPRDQYDFCPYDGLRNYEVRRVFLWGTGREHDEDVPAPGMGIVWGGHGDAYVGAVVARVSDWGGYEQTTPVKIDDVAIAKAATQAVLEPHGLWNEDLFGLWAVLVDG